jgi:hypothetical protein
LWLCLSSYRSCNPTKGVLVITQLFARWMPRPCAGEVHAWGYKTGVPVPRCPGLVPGRFTLGATKREFRFPDAPALCRGGSRLGLQNGSSGSPMPRPCAGEVHAWGSPVVEATSRRSPHREPPRDQRGASPRRGSSDQSPHREPPRAGRISFYTSFLAPEERDVYR